MPDSPVGLSDESPSRREPTHELKIVIPLDLTANPAAEEYDIQAALGQALDAILQMIRLGTLGLLCGDPVVTLEGIVAFGDGPTDPPTREELFNDG